MIKLYITYWDGSLRCGIVLVFQLKVDGVLRVTRDVKTREYQSQAANDSLSKVAQIQRIQPSRTRSHAPPLPPRSPVPKRHFIRCRLRPIHPLIFNQTRIHHVQITLTPLVRFHRRGQSRLGRGELESILRSTPMLLRAWFFSPACGWEGLTCPAGWRT